MPYKAKSAPGICSVCGESHPCTTINLTIDSKDKNHMIRMCRTCRASFFAKKSGLQRVYKNKYAHLIRVYRNRTEPIS